MVTLGDSLTFAYEAGFFSDGFGPEVQNWIEILSSAEGRQDWFDLGERDYLWTLFGGNFYFRQTYNWAVPGMTINQLRRFIDGETMRSILTSNPSYADLVTLLDLSDYQDTDFDVADLEMQIEQTAERMTLFIGSNDVRAVYPIVYYGGDASVYINEFIADATYVLDWVLSLNPNIEIVVVAVPHVGITPDIQSVYPTDPVMTGRVTAALDDLNHRLKMLAEERGLGFADIYSPTLRLLEPNSLCIHGIQFFNTGSVNGDLDYVWLNGQVSANFHPNTSANAVIANQIIDAFNATYDAGIRPLTATEVLGGLLGKDAAEIDMPFADWMTGFGLAGFDHDYDGDGDGIPAGVEFGMGLDPTLEDASKLSIALEGDGSQLVMTYLERLSASSRYELIPTFSVDVSNFVPIPTVPAKDADGYQRAYFPVDAARLFVRLDCEIVP